MLVGEQAATRPGARGNQAHAGRHLGIVVQFGITTPVDPMAARTTPSTR